MQLAIILFINLILWALFYLVISLKLEKSASEFREKRLRREMDEIIREFNETAERNISLLENRITALKRLMSQSGSRQSVDVNIGMEDFTSDIHNRKGGHTTAVDPLVSTAVPEMHAAGAGINGNGAGARQGDKSIASSIKSEAINTVVSFFNKMTIRVRGIKEHFSHSGDSETHNSKNEQVKKSGMPLRDSSQENFPIEKGLEQISSMGFHPKKKKAPDIDEESIIRMFEKCDDKYALITELYSKGCTLDLLTRCSGVPAGEIRLVLNLNRSLDDGTAGQ